MKALTLIQPWAWAIAYAGKDVENRVWLPRGDMIGQRIAIHAGMKREWGVLNALDITPPRLLDQGAVVAVATLSGFAGTVDGQAMRSPGTDRQVWERILGSRWYVPGQCGWGLRDVVALPRPVPCRGALNLWDLPPEVEAEVRRQLEEVADGME